MSIIDISSLSHPGVEAYASLTESQLRNKACPAEGIFIAESPKVIKIALDKGYQPLSLMCERRHIDGDAAEIIARYPGIDVFTGSRQVLAGLTGYSLTRGVLCAMRRPEPAAVADVCQGARRVAVIDGVCDTTNIGAIFRSAAALGIDAVLLSPDSCDPLNRRSIRVSMGTVFMVPWAWLDADYLAQLSAFGFATVAMALRSDSVSIDDPALMAIGRMAIILGTEGDGLSPRVIDGADYVARIPMARGVDSLNVAAASAVAFWQLRSI